ncbi:hypothetical protein HNQ56_000160 [Anaerotaenia torta]|uniref:hypothetical protein n=1 Tax=Anaerotaenia torta TaxID=433293 RepID=UPI003D1A49E8
MKETEKCLNIVFLKVHTFEKELSKEDLQRFEKKKDEINSFYTSEIAGIEQQNDYKEIVEKQENETADSILDTLEKAREEIFSKYARQADNRRKKKLQDLESGVYGNHKIDIVEEIDEKYSEGFDIRCIHYVEEEELGQALEKVTRQFKTMNTSKISYHRYLQLKVVRLKDRDTFKEEIRIEIYNIKFGKEKSDYNGCICSSLSDLDKKLIELIDYGTELGRQEIADIRRIIRNNYSNIPVEQTDLVDEIKLSYICDYIAEKDIKVTIINKDKQGQKQLYLIPSADFDKEFGGYKNMITFRNSLIQEEIMIASRGRGKYKHTDQKYYIAIDADSDRVKEIIDSINNSSVDNDKKEQAVEGKKEHAK